MINVGEWIKKWSTIQPNKTVLISEGKPYTYREMDRRINQTSHLLMKLGVQKGGRVAVLLHNCHQFLELFFALSRIGAILVPLNWRLAGSELEFIIEHSGSSVFIFGNEFEDTVSSIRPHLALSAGHYLTIGSPLPEWSIDYEKSLLACLVAEPCLPSSVDAEDPHIIMYTSGTTGVPKGAVLSHRKTFFNVLNADIFYGLSPQDMMIVSRPLFHSGGLLVDSAPVLYKGGTLILKKRFAPAEILEAVQKYRATLLELPATVYQFILQQCNLSHYDLSSVRYYVTGGERVPTALLREYQRRGITICEIFGQTEASTITFLPPEYAAVKMGSAGLPVFHAEVRVIDKEGRTVKPHEVGEIIIKGPTLMSEYWTRPDLTAETIRDGWLYTGDLAKTDEDGFIYIVDREKDMYISGGENIYPAEVERVFFTHPKVFDVAIVGVPDEKWGEVGKAFIVLKPGETLTEREALEFLQGKVGRYKIPKYVEFVRELPKTASGKIQKYLLKEGHKKSSEFGVQSSEY